MPLDRQDIIKALQNEALARCQYEIYAQIARDEGLHYFAKVLEEIGRNELSHVTEFMRILGRLSDTSSHLKRAIENESYESGELYPKLSQQACSDGELNTGRLFAQIAKIEARHKDLLDKLSLLLDNNSVYKRDHSIVWKCRICGYIYEGLEPPKKCPGCQNTQECYEPEDFSI